MPLNFHPIFSINASITHGLMHIEAVKERVNLLPLNPAILASLYETARLSTTYCSTVIEGNQLTLVEVENVLKAKNKVARKGRDEREIKKMFRS